MVTKCDLDRTPSIVRDLSMRTREIWSCKEAFSQNKMNGNKKNTTDNHSIGTGIEQTEINEGSSGSGNNKQQTNRSNPFIQEITRNELQEVL